MKFKVSTLSLSTSQSHFYLMPYFSTAKSSKISVSNLQVITCLLMHNIRCNNQMGPDHRHTMLCKYHVNTRFQQFQDVIVLAILIVSKYHKMCALSRKIFYRANLSIIYPDALPLVFALAFACLDCNTATSRAWLPKTFNTPRRNRLPTYLPFLDFHIFTFDAESKCSKPTLTEDFSPRSSRSLISPLHSQTQLSFSSLAHHGTKTNAWYLQ